jgi:hypothetical protein
MGTEDKDVCPFTGAPIARVDRHADGMVDVDTPIFPRRVAMTGDLFDALQSASDPDRFGFRCWVADQIEQGGLSRRLTMEDLRSHSRHSVPAVGTIADRLLNWMARERAKLSDKSLPYNFSSSRVDKDHPACLISGTSSGRDLRRFLDILETRGHLEFVTDPAGGIEEPSLKVRLTTQGMESAVGEPFSDGTYFSDGTGFRDDAADPVVTGSLDAGMKLYGDLPVSTTGEIGIRVDEDGDVIVTDYEEYPSHEPAPAPSSGEGGLEPDEVIDVGEDDDNPIRVEKPVITGEEIVDTPQGRLRLYVRPVTPSQVADAVGRNHQAIATSLQLLIDAIDRLLVPSNHMVIEDDELLREIRKRAEEFRAAVNASLGGSTALATDTGKKAHWLIALVAGAFIGGFVDEAGVDSWKAVIGMITATTTVAAEQSGAQIHPEVLDALLACSRRGAANG